jgi:hypothetical protein
MDLLVEKHLQSDDCKKGVQQFVDSQAQHFVVFWLLTIFLFSYNFLQFDEFIFSF